MAQVTKNTFERAVIDIVDISDELNLYALVQLRRISERLIENPDLSINDRAQIRRLQRRWDGFIADAEDWMDTELAENYLRGIEQANGAFPAATATAGAFARRGLLVPDVPSQPISDKAAKILKDYPEHHAMYGAFKQAADSNLRATRVPIVREQAGRIRDITVQAGETAYKNADTFTRRQMSQDLMRRFADDGMTGVRYADGRTMPIDSYSEMVARTQTQQAFNQANWSRMQEYGQDLVVISVHYPCSNLCQPYQGRVFSLSGTSGQYPPINDAIGGGLYHVNCGHHSSGYTPGQKAPERDINTRRNREMYAAQQRQRYQERQIRKFKRRQAASVDPRERAKAKDLMRKWQKANRKHVEANDFLRRKYYREQI